MAAAVAAMAAIGVVAVAEAAVVLVYAKDCVQYNLLQWCLYILVLKPLNTLKTNMAESEYRLGKALPTLDLVLTLLALL